MPFLAASIAFVVDIAVSVVVSYATAPKPVAELAGFVYSETDVQIFADPESDGKRWYMKSVPLAAVMLALAILLNIIFH